jgi:uncharacterized cupin superfamily protein
MPGEGTRKCLLTAADIDALAEARIRHPLNPDSDVRLRPLSEIVGMQRVPLTLARIPPGQESFAYHAHEADEEFLYIVSGRGRAEIGDEMVEVGPGDFMGFATPSLAHHLTNPYDEDLVYLMGGERQPGGGGELPACGEADRLQRQRHMADGRGGAEAAHPQSSGCAAVRRMMKISRPNEPDAGALPAACGLAQSRECGSA